MTKNLALIPALMLIALLVACDQSTVVKAPILEANKALVTYDVTGMT